MNSYELANIILELRTQAEEGLIDAQTFTDTVEGLDVESKLNGLIYASKRLDKEAELLKDEKKRIDAELKKQERNKETIKGLINMLLSASNKNRFEGVAGKISYRKSKTVEVDTGFIEANIGKDFIIKDINYKVDKKALKEILEAHGDINGAYIKINNNLQIK